MSASDDRPTGGRRLRAGRFGRWLLRLVFTLLLAVSCTLVGLFAFERFTLQPLLEHLVQANTGRTLSIDGDLDLRAGRIIRLRATALRLGNAEWGSRDDMLSIAITELSVNLPRLLDGATIIEQLTLQGVRLLFERDEQGRSNWSMGPRGDDSAAATGARGPMALPIAHSQLSDIDIVVIDPALQRPLSIHLDSAGHDTRQAQPLRTSIVGAVDGLPFTVQANAGPLRQLLAAEAVEIDVTASFEAITLEASAKLDSLAAPQRVSANVVLASADIAQVVRTLGLPLSLHGAVRFEAEMRPAGSRHELDISLDSETLDVTARSSLRALDSLDGATVELSAHGPNLGAAAQVAAIEGLPAWPFKLDSALSLTGTRLTIAESHFESGQSHLVVAGAMDRFPALQDTRLELELGGQNYLDYAPLLGIVDVAHLQAAPFAASSELNYNSQGQQLFDAQAKLADVDARFSGELSADPTFAGSSLDYRIEGRNDGLLQQLLRRPAGIEGSYRLQGKVNRVDGAYAIDRASLTLGANTLEVSGTVADDPLQGDSNLAMRFEGAEIGQLAAMAGYTGFMPSGEASIEARARTQDNAIRVEQLEAALGGTRLTASGSISLQPGAQGSRIEAAIVGEDIAAVVPPELTRYVTPGQSFALESTIASERGKLQIETAKARLGETELEARGSVGIENPLTDIALQISTRGPDLAALVPPQSLPYRLPAAQFSATGGVSLTAAGIRLDSVEASVGADRLAVSGRIPLDTPSDGLDLAIAASGPNLDELIPPQIEGLDFAQLPYEVSGRLQLAQGLLSITGLGFSTPRGRIAGDIRVSLAQPRTFGEFKLRAMGDNLVEFMPALPGFTPAAVAFDLDADGGWDSSQLSIKRGALKLGDAGIEARGEINIPPATATTKLVLSAHGENLSDLGSFGDMVLPAAEFHIDATVLSDADSIEIPQLDARVASSDLRGSIRVAFADIPQIRLQLDSELLSLEKLMASADEETETDQPPPSDGRVIPQLALPVDQLGKVNLETRIRIAEVRGRRNSLKDIEIDSILRDGKLTVNRLQATATEGRIVARFGALAQDNRIVTRGRLEAKDILLGKKPDSDSEAGLPKLDLQLEFDSAGATVRELAANLDGYAKIYGGTGRLTNSRFLNLFGSFYEELISSINPFVKREPYTSITCFAAYADIENGLAEINPGAVLQTDKLNMFAGGQLDLNSERINLRFDTSPRSGIGISVADFINPFVGVSGTLARPRLGVDPENAMFEGGFAVATGGLSIVAKSLFNRWFGAKDPCARLEQQAGDFLQQKQEKRNIDTPPPVNRD